MKTAWETELASFLNDLLAVQDAILETFNRKREFLLKADGQGLAALAKEEETLIQRLQDCLRRREDMLRRAADEGLPADSIESLTQTLPKNHRKELSDRTTQAALRFRLLQHHSLTHWVVVQRTLIHLSQMLEMIATGGRMRPTYGKSEPEHAGGTLINRAA